MAGIYSIDKETFIRLAEAHRDDDPALGTTYTLITRRIPADMETPASALLKIRRGSYSFLLESVERGNQVGRFSFLGTDPYRVLSQRVGPGEPHPDPLGQIGALLATRRLIVPEGISVPPFAGGAVGYAGYEVATTLEPVSPAAHDPLAYPDIAFCFYDTFIVFDHVQRTAEVCSLARLCADADFEFDLALTRIERLVRRLSEPIPTAQDNGGSPVKESRATSAGPKGNISQADFERMVENAKEHIAAGDVIQVVLAQRFDRPTTADPFSVYRALRMVNPSPYMFFLQFGELCLVGASPEMLVRVESGKVTTRPIAGTRPRGSNAKEDAALEKELLVDEKERAEHLMLVDLGRNDIGRIARVGTVKVPRFMEVERYSHVMHLVSEVEGDLAEGMGAVDALKACFPAGTVSGAPKVRAMQIIAEQERDRRGPYAGAVGYIGFDGNMDTAITIRTIEMKDGIARVQAGAGIVADSVPENEYRESIAKAQALMTAIERAERLESESTEQAPPHIPQKKERADQ